MTASRTPPYRRRPVGPRSPLARSGRRLHAGLVFVAVLLALLGGRLLWLQGISSTAYAEDAALQRLRTTTLVAPRGAILDRAGHPLALSVDARAVYGEPRVIAKARCQAHATVPCDPAGIAAALAPVLHLPAAGLQAKLSGSGAFVYLARGLDPSVGAAVSALRLVGVGVLPESRRVHPGGDLAVNVTGFTNIDGKGLAGIESSLQPVLAGRNGTQTAQVDAFGRVIPTGTATGTPPVPGRDVELTIDRDLQWYAQQLLAQKVAETQAQSGSIVVMDVRTGQVLALATEPTFNPDAPVWNASPQAMGNPAVTDVYEPGSVSKVVTAAAALESGVVTPDTPVTVPPTIQVAGHTVHDAEQHGTERLTFTGVIAQSSNIGTVEVAQKVGPQRLYDEMRQFGYGQPTGVGLPGESGGLLPPPSTWSGTSIATLPIGQGLSVTVMQLASVYATVANNGVRITPTIVKAIADPSGRLVPTPPPATQRVIPDSVATQLRAMLEAVVTSGGTAPQAAIPGYRVAGKTGTAQRVVHGRYQPGNYTSSFIGMAPADAPRVVTAVVLQGTGRNGYFGGSVAGPVFQSVTGFALRSLGVPPSGTVAPPPVLYAR